MTELEQDLQNAIINRLTFSLNASPTCQGKIKHIEDGYAIVEVVANPSDYMQESNKEHADKIGTVFMMPQQLAHNAIYF